MRGPNEADAPDPRISEGGRDTHADSGAILRREDWDLVQATIRRQPTALERFAERMRCVGRFLAAENRRLGAPLDAHALADVAQDVITTVWQRLPRFRGDASLETWVYRFCDFSLRNALRRLAVRRSVAILDPESFGSIAADEPDPGAADTERVHIAIDALPLDEAVAVRLKQFDGLTFDEIGQRLQISPNTVRSRYYRALDRLRAVLNPGPEARP